MTMRIKVTNEDQHRSLRVTPADAKPADYIECGVESVYSQTLLPGESCEVYAHSTRVILLEEIPL